MAAYIESPSGHHIMTDSPPVCAKEMTTYLLWLRDILSWVVLGSLLAVVRNGALSRAELLSLGLRRHVGELVNEREN